jgi:hypothetical protein
MDTDRSAKPLYWNPAIGNHPSDRPRVELP